MTSFADRRRARWILTLVLSSAVVACGAEVHDLVLSPGSLSGPFGMRGGWLAPRSGAPLDSAGGAEVLRQMRTLGVNVVAVGQEVEMPAMGVPALRWGADDDALRGVLRRVRRAGLRAFLLPRIESPDFFKPPYPFRADIDFPERSQWDRFHADMTRMVLHYARLAEAEGVAVFGLGLELKHSVRKHPEFWRGLIAKVRGVYRGKITYSANWYDEWRTIEFWSELDFIGVGAYFELRGEESPGQASKAQIVARWEPIVAELAAASKHFGRRVLFTEVGYTGYIDCAERPWEWAGKTAKGIAIDHDAQARATGALLDVVAAHDFFAGLFLWSFYTNPSTTASWEYAVQGRPAEAEVRRGFSRPK
jgi:Glycoside Hydrolase Family 113